MNWKGFLEKAEKTNTNHMKLSREEINKVAHLARLKLTEVELIEITGQLEKILQYIEKLKEVNTEGIKPTSHVIDINNSFREDVTIRSLDKKDVFSNAVDQNGEFFIVPKII